VDGSTALQCSVLGHRKLKQGFHASWKVMESPGFFSLKFQDLESPGKSLWSWKVLEIEV